EAHTLWPSAHLIMGLVGAGKLSDAEASDHFFRALSLRQAVDPLLADLGELLGTDRVYARYGLALLYQLGRSNKESKADVEKLVAALIPLLGESIEARLLKSLREVGEYSRPEAALEMLRQAKQAIPDELTPDAVAIFVAGLFYSFLLELESQIGDEE